MEMGGLGVGMGVGGGMYFGVGTPSMTPQMTPWSTQNTPGYSSSVWSPGQGKIYCNTRQQHRSRGIGIKKLSLLCVIHFILH